MSTARSSPWLNDRAALLVQLLASRGLTVSERAARQDISDYLNQVAARMRISRQAAKPYLGEEMIEALADHIAVVVDEHSTVVDLDLERRRRR